MMEDTIVREGTFSVHSIHCDLNTVKHCMYVSTQDRRAGGQDSGMESVIHHKALLGAAQLRLFIFAL